nr:truncated semaphorin [Ectromelia virus]
MIPLLFILFYSILLTVSNGISLKRVKK